MLHRIIYRDDALPAIELMKNGWQMKEIDEMDMPGFLCLRAWDAAREQEKKHPGSASLMKSGRG